MIRDKTVFGLFDKKVQDRMLRNSNLSLKDVIDLCRAAELSQSQLADIPKQEEIGLHEMAKDKAGDCTVCRESGHSAPRMSYEKVHVVRYTVF